MTESAGNSLHRRMNKEELARRLSALQINAVRDPADPERETELAKVLHDVEVYQIELEMQVRELKESRQELEDSHNRYVDLYDFAPVGYVTFSDSGTVEEINLTAAAMLGVERQWLLKRSFGPWVLSPDILLFRTHLKQCRDEGGTVKTSLRLLNRRKQPIAIELLTTCFSDPQTGKVSFRSAITDLTDRRKAEADLDRFFNLSSDLLCIVGIDGKFQRVNPASELIFGYTPNALVGSHCFDYVHPDDQDLTRAQLAQLSQGGTGHLTFQNRCIRKDLSVVWLAWSVIASGDLIYCVARDITEQVEARILVENHYNWMKEMVATLPIPMALIESGSGSLVSVSELSESLFRGFPETLSDVPHSDSFCASPEGVRLPLEEWPRMRAARGEEMNQEPIFWRSRGGTAYHQVSSRNIPESYGQPAMSILVTQDVTQLKAIEDALRVAIQNLERERDLRERFVSALTHDLRTPLTAAKLMAQFLGSRKMNPEGIPKLSEQLVKNVDRIDHMIQDLLDANRIRAGEKLPLKRSVFDLSSLIETTVQELSLVHRDRLVFESPGEIVGNWSKHGLRRVIENLVGNGVKYGALDKPITLSLMVPARDRLVLSIHNFGNPIPIEEQPTLFQQFRRASFAQKGAEKGWGIGLTLVRGIVEAHGGEITVESSVEKGTTFFVALPWKPA